HALGDSPSRAANSLKTSTRPPDPLASSAASLSKNSPSDPRANTPPPPPARRQSTSSTIVRPLLMGTFSANVALSCIVDWGGQACSKLALWKEFAVLRVCVAQLPGLGQKSQL